MTFYLAYPLAFYLAYLLAFVLTFFLAFCLAYLLTFCLAYLLTFFLTSFLAYILIFFSGIFLAFRNILSGISYDILSDIFSDILSGISSDILSGISSDILSRIFSHILPVEVQQCPLRSGSRGWGPAVPTAIWKSRLKSGSAHCDLEVAVEVRQCPLRFGSRGWGPAVPTAIWKSRLRSGSAHWDLELAVGVRQCPLGSGARGRGPAVPTGIWTARRRWRRRRRRRTALIKSNNPHLAGGEKCKTCLVEVSMGAWHFFTEPSKTNLPIWTQAKTVGHLLDISVPNFLCCVKAWPAWRNFWKTTVFAPVMVGNFDSGCPEASGACWNVLLFLNNKLTIFSDVWTSTYLFGHMLLLLLLFLLLLLLLLLFPETVFMQMWPHDNCCPQRDGCPRVNSDKWHALLPTTSACARGLIASHRKCRPQLSKAAPLHLTRAFQFYLKSWSCYN